MFWNPLQTIFKNLWQSPNASKFFDSKVKYLPLSLRLCQASSLLFSFPAYFFVIFFFFSLTFFFLFLSFLPSSFSRTSQASVLLSCGRSRPYCQPTFLRTFPPILSLTCFFTSICLIKPLVNCIMFVVINRINHIDWLTDEVIKAAERCRTKILCIVDTESKISSCSYFDMALLGLRT